jgi:hypothetical protein
MFQIVTIILIISSLALSAEILYKNEFMIDNNGWRITGNKVEEPAVHQSYNLNRDMSHYIMFKDNLINSEPKNPSDRTLWYFESASIIINPNHKYESIASKQYKPIYPTVLTFTMTSFVGDFRRLNSNLDLVRIKNGANTIAFKAPTDYDGNMRTFNVPIVRQLWHFHNGAELTDEEFKNMFIGPFIIEILGDWTQGIEVIGLDNVIIWK